MIEIPTIAIALIVVSVVGIVVGTLLLAIWLVSIIPVMLFFISTYALFWPLIALVSLPFVILGGGPFILMYGSFISIVMLLVIAVLATAD